MKNFRVDRSLDIIKNSKNNIILFGEVGSGKTTLINKLCDTKFKVMEGGYSCTRDIQFGYSKTNDIIIDCPGLNAAEEISRHLKIQKFILSVIPVKIICFVIKLNNRYDLLYQSALQMIKIFYEHKKNIVVIITFAEKITQIKMNEIQTLFIKKLGLDKTKIIFSSNDVTSLELTKKLNDIKINLVNITSIKFKEKNLLSDDMNIGLDIIEFKEKKMNEYKNSIKIFQKIFDSTKIIQLKYALLKTFQYYKSELIDLFKEKLINKIQDIDTINIETIMFSNELYEYLNIIVDKFEKSLQNSQKLLVEIDKNSTYGKYCYQIKNTEKKTSEKNNNIIFGNFEFCKIVIKLDNFNIYIIDNNKNFFNNNTKNIAITDLDKINSDNASDLPIYKNIIDNIINLETKTNILPNLSNKQNELVKKGISSESEKDNNSKNQYNCIQKNSNKEKYKYILNNNSRRISKYIKYPFHLVLLVVIFSFVKLIMVNKNS